MIGPHDRPQPEMMIMRFTTTVPNNDMLKGY
jgi:hypothetical protein